MISHKIKELRTKARLTQADLAARLGVTQQAVAKWEAARSLPEPRIIGAISSLFGVSADFLLDLCGSVKMTVPFSSVRIIGTVKAGYGAPAFEEDLGEAAASIENPEQYRYLTVNGDSMDPFIREGDLALVRLQSDLQNGDIGVFIYGDSEATIKKFRHEKNVVKLIPFNSAYDTVVVSGDDINDLIIFGKVVQTSTKW